MTWKAAGCGRCQDLQGALSVASGQGQAGRAGLWEGGSRAATSQGSLCLSCLPSPVGRGCCLSHTKSQWLLKCFTNEGVWWFYTSWLHGRFLQRLSLLQGATSRGPQVTLGHELLEKALKKLMMIFLLFQFKQCKVCTTRRIILVSFVSVCCKKCYFGKRKVHVLSVSIYAFCILLPRLVCGILSFITSHCWYVCTASADACWLHCMFPKIQTSEQQDSMKKGVERK